MEFDIDPSVAIRGLVAGSPYIAVWIAGLVIACRSKRLDPKKRRQVIIAMAVFLTLTAADLTLSSLPWFVHFSPSTAVNILFGLGLVHNLIGACALILLLQAAMQPSAFEKNAAQHLTCEQCGYDLFGINDGRCPECGQRTAEINP